MNALRMGVKAVDYIEATTLKKELASEQALALVDDREQGLQSLR